MSKSHKKPVVQDSPVSTEREQAPILDNLSTQPDDIETFDLSFAGVSRADAKKMLPQAKLDGDKALIEAILVRCARDD